MVETFICLYCNAKLVGDNAWFDHLKSKGHGAAKLSSTLLEPKPEPDDE